MRIQKIIELTGLTKKTIHYYIESQLITPIKDQDNGYYIFSEDDLNKLSIIIKLRKLNMPISLIKEYFQYPSSTNFFLHTHMNNLKEKVAEYLSNIDDIYYILDKIPPNARSECLLNETINTEYRYDIIDSIYPNNDARMIAIILWAPFLTVEANEYRVFLWSRISKELSLVLKNNLRYLEKFIYHLSAKEIVESSVDLVNLNNEIITTPDDELNKYCDMLLKKIDLIISQPMLQKYWITLYDKIIVPTYEFYDSKCSNLLQEYNNKYFVYKHKMNIISFNVYNHLLNNKELYFQLKKALNNKIDINDNNYQRIGILLTFDISVFIKIPLHELNTLLSD